MRNLARIFLLAVAIESGAMTAHAAADNLVAIDVLLRPDAAMAAKAKALNARLRADLPIGFALDATHVPHITVLQCYVRARDLRAVERAVDAVFRRAPPAGLKLTATGLFNSRVADVAATGIAIRTTPELARLQRGVADALAPFLRHGGTPAAFVATPDSETIRWTVTYVDTFGEKASGANYAPHVTAGIAHPNFVARLAAAPFAPFDFATAGAAIYQLGDIGTARKRLWVWRP